jgi:hypothetical protein
MSARKLPTAQDAATARQVLLDGLEHDVGIVEILNQLAPLPAGPVADRGAFNRCSNRRSWCDLGYPCRDGEDA